MTTMLTGIDPRDGSQVGDGVPEAGPDEARAAAAAAAEALRDRGRAGTDGGFDDEELLEAIAGRIEAATHDLIEVAVRETGLAPDRLRGEVARTTGQLRAFAAARREGLLADAIIETADADATPPKPDQRRVARPLGPVAVFAASNFPFAFSVAGGDTASALAAGCPVLLKAHPAHPETSRATAEAVVAGVRDAGAPPAWFQVLHGRSPDLGQALATAPDVAAVAFTGSLRAGRALFDAAAARDVPIPVFAEMGSVNPLVVTPGALARRGTEVARAVAGAVLGSGGQLCTKPNLVLTVEGQGLEAFVEELTGKLGAVSEVLMLTTGLRDGFAASWERVASAPQARELVAGTPLDRDGAWQSPALAALPARVFLERPDLLEEHFGPGTVVAVAADTSELTRLAAVLPGTLTATVHAEDDEGPDVGDLVHVLSSRAGRLVWNGLPTGVTVGFATVHGGPYPATTAPSTTSVGLTAARRFQRPVGYQSWPDALLPAELRDANPLGIVRLVDGRYTRDSVRRSAENSAGQAAQPAGPR